MTTFIYRYPIPNEQLDPIDNWHSFYFFDAFYKAREELFRQHGVTKERMNEAGLAIIAGEVHCKYLSPIKKGVVAVIEITPVRIGRSSMEFSCMAYKEGDDSRTLCAEGTTFQKVLEVATQKTAEAPSWIRSIFS